jgi:hypothetical protein
MRDEDSMMEVQIEVSVWGRGGLRGEKRNTEMKRRPAVSE